MGGATQVTTPRLHLHSVHGGFHNAIANTSECKTESYIPMQSQKTSVGLFGRLWYTVEPLLTDPLRSGQPP